MTSRSRRHGQVPAVPFAVLLLSLVTTSGCVHVEFYEKRAFSDPVMSFDEGPTEAHWYEKVYHSTEGAAGGLGLTAGGGCGCY